MPLMARISLARHARTALNASGQLRGRLDPPLDDVGRGEAEALAAAMASAYPTRVVSSPLHRAIQTAEAIAIRANLPLVLDDRLVDRDYGAWAGTAEAELIANFGSLENAPSAEAGQSVIERAQAAIDAQLPYLASGPVVVVSHDAVNRLLLGALRPDLQRSGQLRQRTACWNVLSWAARRWSVERVDEGVRVS